MASSATVSYDVVVYGANGIAQRQRRTVRIPIGAGTAGKRETKTLTASSFNALTVPTGAKMLLILLGSATSITLKGITGDSGIALTPSSNPVLADAMIPLGTSPSIGLLNGNTSDVDVELLWL